MHALSLALDGCTDDLFADSVHRDGHAGEAYGLRSGLWIAEDDSEDLAYLATAVRDRTSPDEGGFAPEEIALVRRAIEAGE